MPRRVKIKFELNPEDGQGYETESLWAERQPSGEYCILNSPFFVYGISAGDIVTARRRAHARYFQGISRRGGHSTYRVFLQGGCTIRDASFKKRWAEVAALGCTLENANDRLIAVDVSPEADIVQVYKLLQQGEEEVFWAFEEGYYAGPKAVGGPSKRRAGVLD